MPDTTILDGNGEQTLGRRPLDGTDLERAYNLVGDDLVLRVDKAGVQVFGGVLEKAAKPVTAHTTYISRHHRRVDGRTAAELNALPRCCG